MCVPYEETKDGFEMQFAVRISLIICKKKADDQLFYLGELYWAFSTYEAAVSNSSENS
jgi:hypothetical protein